MGKKLLIALGILVLVLAVGAGGFYGGMLYEQNRASSASARFFADRGGAAGYPGVSGTPGVSFPGGTANRGGVFGQVKTIDGDTLTISTAQDVTTVHLTASTVIDKVVTGALADLQPGDTVTVRGERDAAGVVTATLIQVGGTAGGFGGPAGAPTVTPTP